MKRRIRFVGHEDLNVYPGDFSAASKYVHCVEAAADFSSINNSSTGRVVVEWGANNEHSFGGMGTLELLVRYRCDQFPSVGMFYLLLYNDPYRCVLHEVYIYISNSI
jgi:hypothetical protein